MSADPKAVDVLRTLTWALSTLRDPDRNNYPEAIAECADDLKQARAAVAELIEAGRALQEAMDTPEKGPFDSLTVKHFHEADARHRTALARCGGAS